jgi:hypothetical protein
VDCINGLAFAAAIKDDSELISKKIECFVQQERNTDIKDEEIIGKAMTNDEDADEPGRSVHILPQDSQR